MKAVVLEQVNELSWRDIELSETLGSREVRIAVHTVGICGSDLHFLHHGRIGPFVVTSPLVLGHEASGTIVEVGPDVTELLVGDRVCMEPGVPDPTSRPARLGLYNLDPGVEFWATPPGQGCLRETVVHAADFTYRLPDSVSYGEGAMVEPLAVGMHGATKAKIKPGDVAVVLGAGTIGMVTALAALAGGCSRVVISDMIAPKLALAATLGPITPFNVAEDDLGERVRDLTDGWGADLVFECSGHPAVVPGLFDLLCPGGAVVFIGMFQGPIPYDTVAAMMKEARVEHVFRYAHQYPRSLALMGSGKIDLKPLITDVFPFSQSLEAFAYASDPRPTSVKVQIEVAVE
ncbi:MAG: NAD(P)-dependent alcohol dehydrogenase [Armatimonadetes bacterium]|nr:NAD(P)-dependent alcohol dehydrogenase [Armatimonadota bacterium]